MTDVTFRQALRSTLVAAALVVALPPSPIAIAQEAALEAQFKDPPTSARPRVWWHWMNGNITEDGIAKDMAWMKRAGIGGLQNFDAALTTPPIVPQRLAFMTPEWKKAFRFAAAEADRNGLELAIAASPGWSETGGPWVDAKDGMKKLVWSETVVSGGQPFAGTPSRTAEHHWPLPAHGLRSRHRRRHGREAVRSPELLRGRRSARRADPRR